MDLAGERVELWVSRNHQAPSIKINGHDLRSTHFVYGSSGYESVRETNPCIKSNHSLRYFQKFLDALRMGVELFIWLSNLRYHSIKYTITINSEIKTALKWLKVNGDPVTAGARKSDPAVKVANRQCICGPSVSRSGLDIQCLVGRNGPIMRQPKRSK